MKEMKCREVKVKAWRIKIEIYNQWCCSKASISTTLQGTGMERKELWGQNDTGLKPGSASSQADQLWSS
jgi:hypothetical protein